AFTRLLVLHEAQSKGTSAWTLVSLLDLDRYGSGSTGADRLNLFIRCCVRRPTTANRDRVYRAACGDFLERCRPQDSGRQRGELPRAACGRRVRARLPAAIS